MEPGCRGGEGGRTPTPTDPLGLLGSRQGLRECGLVPPLPFGGGRNRKSLTSHAA